MFSGIANSRAHLTSTRLPRVRRSSIFVTGCLKVLLLSFTIINSNSRPKHLAKMDPQAEFSDLNPYETLSVPPTATAAEIRTAYRRLALSTHPDKAPLSRREAAHTGFQRVAFAYAVLSDEQRRARYDRTGSTSESVFDADDEGFDWADFFKSQYEEVSADAVKKFKQEYQGVYIFL